MLARKLGSNASKGLRDRQIAVLTAEIKPRCRSTTRHRIAPGPNFGSASVDNIRDNEVKRDQTTGCRQLEDERPAGFD